MTIAAPSIVKATPERLAALKAKIERYSILEEKQRCEESLSEFVRCAWPSIDSAPYAPCWAIDALADHLECVSSGHIKRLLINISPRTGKTSVCSILFPAWIWARSQVSFLSGPQVKFLCASNHPDSKIQGINKRYLQVSRNISECG